MQMEMVHLTRASAVSPFDHHPPPPFIAIQIEQSKGVCDCPNVSNKLVSESIQRPVKILSLRGIGLMNRYEFP